MFSENSRSIRLLSERTVCRIAAGEVIDRPAGAVKELVENALDAGADNIRITLVNGGRTLMAVSDNGCGIDAASLPYALRRHATSKLARIADDDDLVNIGTYGFRGEALAALGSSAVVKIITRTAQADSALMIEADNGILSEIKPAAGSYGTLVEVRDLFAAVPARLKFLKTDRAETSATLDMVRAVAGGVPHAAFLLEDGKRTIWQAAAGDLPQRIDALCGEGFSSDALNIERERGGMRISGRAGTPGQARGTSAHQWFYVNGRRVRDKLVAGALRAAYRSVLDRDSYPAAVLYLSIPADEVDVNVHPAKTEVRFKDAEAVRGLLIGALLSALERPGRAVPTMQPRLYSPALGSAAAPAPALPRVIEEAREKVASPGSLSISVAPEPVIRPSPVIRPLPVQAAPSPPPPVAVQPLPHTDAPPLGFAKAQLHRTYIVAENSEGLVLVDQHAAHERLTLEAMRSALRAGTAAQRVLLLPVPVTLSAEAASAVLTALSDAAGGFALEAFGQYAVLVRAVPAVLPPDADVAKIIRDFADRLVGESANGPPARELIDDYLADCACRNSIRAGRTLSLDEMNALLRQIEQTPNADRCNHGRPTVLTLSLREVERLFGRR